MSLSKGTLLVMGLAAIGVVSGAATLAIAQAPSQDVISKLDNNQGIFVDKKSFDVVKGASAKSDPLATLTKMGAGKCLQARSSSAPATSSTLSTARRPPTFRLRP